MQQIINAINQPIRASTIIPGSKSITNRALLLAALADGVSEISDILLSDDTKAFINALTQLGIAIQLDETTRSCIIAGNNGTFPKQQASIWCEDAGTVSRFLLAACASTAGVYHFDGTPRLRERPILPLIRILAQQGAHFLPSDIEKMPLTLVGANKLEGGEIIIDSSLTSQTISALLMIAPYAKTAFNFSVINLVSEPYIDLTCAVMADFGVTVRRIHQGQYQVPIPQHYQSRDYVVEPDFSTASYFFAAAAATGGEITIQPVNYKTSKQADAKFLSVLESMGCEISMSNSGLTVKGPAQLNGIEVNMRDFSDTFMTLAAIAPFANSPVKITNIGHTRLKESDRINAVKTALTKMGIQVESGHDWIKIFPGTPTGCLIDSHNDHRIAMAFSITGLRTSG